MKLRLQLLCEVDEPIVLEAYAGAGHLFDMCYRFIDTGVAIEQDKGKVNLLAKQRPTWAVYQAEAVKSLQLGAGSHVLVNFLDLDPYGAPWPALLAFLTSPRPLPDRLAIAVNDGLRQKIQISGGWDVECLRPLIENWGNGLFERYLEACEELMSLAALRAGYTLRRWLGYYCGHNHCMTHYAAVLER